MSEHVLGDMDLLVTSKEKLCFVISLDMRPYLLRYSKNRRRRHCHLARRPYSGVQLQSLDEWPITATAYRLPDLTALQKSLMKSVAARLLGTETQNPAERMLQAIGRNAEELDAAQCHVVGNVEGAKRRKSVAPLPAHLSDVETLEIQQAFSAALKRPFNVVQSAQRC